METGKNLLRAFDSKACIAPTCKNTSRKDRKTERQKELPGNLLTERAHGFTSAPTIPTISAIGEVTLNYLRKLDILTLLQESSENLEGLAGLVS